jgi:DNA-binding transcriptional regulator YhcF (GntR family)
MAKRVPKYARVAATVQGLIADGTLRPGQPAPSGAALSRVTGYSTLTCRRALRVLIADGVLTPGPSRNARPRVAGPPQQQTARDLSAASRALSADLAARRRSYGLTQPELAALIGVSVTTIGHAETGRLWQSRDFWVHADAVLGAGGDLLRLHDAFGEASAASTADDPAAADAGNNGAAGSASAAGSAAEPAHPEGAGTAEPGAEPAPGGGARASGPGGAPLPQGQGTEPAACLAGGRSAARGRAAPACVMIMWGDGTVTTVHPPEAPAPDAPDETPPS